MSQNSKIEWTDSTFNPWIGCTKISPGCDHCYAERDMDIRRHRVKWGAGQPRSRTSAAYWKQPLRWNAYGFWQCESCAWRGENPETDGCPSCALLGTLAPARRRVFCASLADVFDNEVDPAWRLDLFTLIASTPNLDWLLLTKRIGNAEAMIADVMRSRPWNAKWPWPNVWLGATIVNQDEADRDIHKLLATPASVRFLSCEPLLGPIDLARIKIGKEAGVDWSKDAPEEWKHVRTLQFVMNSLMGAPLTGIPNVDWVIAGGESGPRARPVHPDWIRSLRDQCASAGVPYLFKQWGEYVIGDIEDDGSRFVFSADVHTVGPIHEYERERVSTVNAHGEVFGRMGKKIAARWLDGREHSEFPKAA